MCKMGHKGDKQPQRGAWSLFMCVLPCTVTIKRSNGQLNDACTQAGGEEAGTTELFPDGRKQTASFEMLRVFRRSRYFSSALFLHTPGSD